MKKLSAILLIALFLFNLFGYKLVFNYLQQQSDFQFVTSLDRNDYNDEDLVTIKVPLSLPYLNNQQNFERVDGEITLNGKILKYVKRKIADGNLILLCLPDPNKMRIKSAKDEFYKYANDLAQNNQSKKPGDTKPGVFKNLLSEYNINDSEDNFSFCNILKSFGKTARSSFLPSSHCKLPEQPPEVI